MKFEWTIRAKLFMGIVLPMIAMVIFLGIFIHQVIHTTIMSDKKGLTTAAVDLAHGVVANSYTAFEKGVLTEEEAKAKAIADLRDLRFLNGDYIFVYDMTGTALMVPVKSQIEGKNLIHVKDKNGTLFIKSIVENARAGNGEYTSYMWPSKENKDVFVEKLSYSKKFDAWEWVIGTGIYVQEVSDKAWLITLKTLGFLSIGFLLMLFIMFYVTKVGVVDSIKKVCERLNDSVCSIRRGELEVKYDQDSVAVDFRPVIQGFAETVEAFVTPIREAMIVMKSIAEKRLSVNMTGEYEGEFQDFKMDVNAAIGNLREVFGQVHVACETIEKGTNEVTTANDTFAQTSSEQAASLEEVSSAMKEINNHVSSNAEITKQAHTLIDDTMGKITAGKNVMEEMVGAMKKITVSSDNISKIIQTIDEIAFQTNLLALNAAVEAARAGKYGKGFAVVADEVRNLASRSAVAAKETTELIESSRESIKNGQQSLERTEESNIQVGDNVGELFEMVKTISDSSQFQAMSINRVSESVTQIEHTVQSNAAQSQENAAQTHEIASRTKDLYKMIKTFEL